MSTLIDIEKRYVEKLLGMQSGYVLDYSDAKYNEFFTFDSINIHGGHYQLYGISKAKKMRAFWDLEADVLVGQVLDEMLDSYETCCDLYGRAANTPVLEKLRNIVARLLGKTAGKNIAMNEDDFLNRGFTIPVVQSLPIEHQYISIVESRLTEARAAMKDGAHLSVIFLFGSVLEAVLLGSAQQEPALFKQTLATPKYKDGSLKRFYE